MFSISVLSQSICSLYQGLDAVYSTAQLELSRTEYCSLNLHHVFEAIDHAVNTDGITIIKLECCHVKFAHVEDLIALSCLAHQSYRRLVGITKESSCIRNESGNGFILSHLIEHGALHIARHAYQALIGWHLDEVVVLQVDVSGQTAFKDEFIEVDFGDEFTVAIDFNITHSTQIAYATCTV